jgi:hypothetical protein
MKIFLSLKTPRDDGNLRAVSLALADTIHTAGHEPFVAWKEIEEQGLSPQQFMSFVRENLRRSDLLLVLYHPQLRGGLIELGIAFAFGIPIWLAHRGEEQVSSSAMGCADLVLEYTSRDELKEKIREHLHHLPHHE